MHAALREFVTLAREVQRQLEDVIYGMLRRDHSATG